MTTREALQKLTADDFAEDVEFVINKEMGGEATIEEIAAVVVRLSGAAEALASE